MDLISLFLPLLTPQEWHHRPGALIALLPLPLAAFLLLAVRRRWPLSFRRAIFLFLLVALGNLALFLPERHYTSLKPHLHVFAHVIVLLAAFECLQGVFFDLLHAGVLRRRPVPRIIRDTLTLVIGALALLLSLWGVLGIDLASFVATSAMLSVVLGLALQETLGSFFSGLALQMEAPVAIGDWIEVDQHQGQVTQVSWRSLRLVTLDGDEVTLPNVLITRSVLRNLSRPTLKHRLSVAVGVHYRHPPHRVTALLVEALRECPGVLADPAPDAILVEFGDSAITYRARFWIEDFPHHRQIVGEAGARIWYRLHRAGLEIPFPIRVLERPRRERRRVPELERTAKVLGSVELLRPLGGAEVRELAARVRVAFYGRGETVIREGEPGESMFVIIRGSAEVRVSRSGHQGVVAALGAGSFFGEMSLLTGEPRKATVSLLEDSELVEVSKAAIEAIVRANPSLLEVMTAVVAGRRGHLQDTIRETDEVAARDRHQDLLERVRSFFGI